MTEKTLTTENIKPALDALRGELAPWPVVAKKQDRLNTAQLNAANSGITSSLVAQIIANTAAIRALESAITGTGLRALVVASLPAVGTTGILYIVPVTTYDPDTDADVVNYSNEYIWIPVEGGTASEGHYEQVGQTGIVINDGQLTITVNGTSVGTFTANQSGDTTAAITVPTNADYVDRTTDQTVAGVKTFSDGIVGDVTGTASRAIADADGNTISSTYGKLAGSQTWTGTNTFNDLKSTGDFIPSADITSNIGSATYRWNSIWVGSYKSKSAHIDLTDSVTTGNKESWYFSSYDKNENGFFSLGNQRNHSAGSNEEHFRIKNANGRWADFYLKLTDSNEFSVALSVHSSVTNKGFRGKFVPSDHLIPFANSNYDLGNSSYRWSSVYADSYYYGTTAWGLDKANVWSNVQTIKTSSPTLNLQSSSIQKGVAPASNSDINLYGKDLNDNELYRIKYRASSTGERRLWIGLNDLYANGAISSTGTSTWSSFNLYLRADGTPDATVEANLLPHRDATYDCGNSSYKWKTLNGINPGALSLPSSNYVEIDTTNWDLTGATSQSYTPAVPGWLFVSIQNIAGNYLSIVGGRGAVSMDGTGVQAGLRAMLPVVASESVEITVKTGSIFAARFYPAQGNV